jgi:hypothetical protein
MSRYTINTTFEEFSAGTEVMVLEEGSSPLEGGKYYSVYIPGQPLDSAFDIPQSLVTKRRNRTDDIGVPTRQERRIGIEPKAPIHEQSKNL